MSLIINDPTADQLAQSIAEATGDSIAKVVTDALRDRYAALAKPKGKASAEEIVAMAEEIYDLQHGFHHDHAGLLYGEDGLPK